MNVITKPIQHRPIKIGMVQINNSFSGQNYLPYSTAILESYVSEYSTDPARYDWLMPIYKRQQISKSVAHLLNADVVGFSTYVWNGRISLEIAKRLKAERPEIMIIFGGPHVPDYCEDWLRENDFIDVAVHNEGEKTLLALLEAFPNRDWAELPGVSFIAKDGAYVKNMNAPRIRDLSEVPSPFLNGAFKKLMAANPDEQWIGLWETNRGCPFQCTYCDWGSATAAKVTKFEMDRLLAEVDWFADSKVEYIFCCDANFGIQKRDIQLAEYVAEVKRTKGYPHALSVQNTKNATERAYQTQKILADAGLNKGVALSMQSLDMNTLKSIKRDNISLETYLELQRRFTRDRVETYSDLILGMPGETYESFASGLSCLIETGQHNRIQFNNLSILPNAEMGNLAYQAKYGMKWIESEIINIHGEKVQLDDDVTEVQQLVTATASMPEEAWARTRALCWMAAFLHFNKILQIPIIVTHELSGVPYRDLFEAFMNPDADRYPLLAEIAEFYREEARKIQNGGAEYVYSKDWLGIYWPADEYMFIKLTDEKKIDIFYAEAGTLLNEIVAGKGPQNTSAIIADAVTLNRALLSQPFESGQISVSLDHDIMAFYQAVRVGETMALVKKPVTVEIDRDTRAYTDFQAWCKEVVWWGNKKGAYLYTNNTKEQQLAGHY